MPAFAIGKADRNQVRGGDDAQQCNVRFGGACLKITTSLFQAGPHSVRAGAVSELSGQARLAHRHLARSWQRAQEHRPTTTSLRHSNAKSFTAVWCSRAQGASSDRRYTTQPPAPAVVCHGWSTTNRSTPLHSLQRSAPRACCSACYAVAANHLLGNDRTCSDMPLRPAGHHGARGPPMAQRPSRRGSTHYCPRLPADLTLHTP